MSQDQRQLDARLQEARARLSELEGEVRAVDAELESLAGQRRQYELLERACASLDELQQQGIAELFWGDGAAAEQAAAHVSQVRTRVETFHETVSAIEARREQALQVVRRQQDVVDDLDEDLFQAREQEARRKQEWVVEREVTELPTLALIMPWVRGGDDDQLFRKSLAGSLLAALLLGLLIPLIELPVPERDELPEVPERLARLVREKQAPPPTEAALVEEEPVPEEEPEPEPEPEEEPEPQVAEAPTQQEAPAARESSAPEAVQSKGILAFRDSIANLAQRRPTAKLGSEARIRSSGEAASGRPERSMVTTEAPGSSGGINLASLSRNVAGGGGGDLEGVEAARVASTIDGKGGADRPTSRGAVAGRTDEEIQIVFDRYKAALYRLYNRELRRDPTLRGQMLLRLTIEPDGSVSMCELQSSDMDAPDLARQVVARVKAFDFGAKDVPAVTILYPIDFLPAG